MDPISTFLEYGAVALIYLVVGFAWYIIYKVNKRIEEIEKKDIESAGKFELIENQLETINTNVQKILDYFMAKGMQ